MRTYEDEAKESEDYDDDGYNNILDYQYESYPYGNRDEQEPKKCQ
jgi:hypothetical protein